MTSLRMLLAANMKEYRQKLGLSQSMLAERTSVSTQYISDIERERKFPSPEKLEKLAQALEIDTPDLFAFHPSARGTALMLRREILADLEKKVSEKLTETLRATVSEIVSRHLHDFEERQSVADFDRMLKNNSRAPAIAHPTHNGVRDTDASHER